MRPSNLKPMIIDMNRTSVVIAESSLKIERVTSVGDTMDIMSKVQCAPTRQRKFDTID